MRRFASFVFVVLALILSMQSIGFGRAAYAASQDSFSSPRTATKIHGEIVATGRYVFTWVDDDLCTLAFWDYDFTPNLVVTDAENREIASLPLAELPGSVTMAGTGDKKHAEICTVPFELAVPSSSSYQVALDPYFASELLTSDDLKATGGRVDIAFERQEGGRGPDFRKRPAGKLPGTDQYRIAGTFELLADPKALTFFALPIGGCMGIGGYEDLVAGKQITVSDQTGTIVAVGELEPIYLPEGDIGEPGDQRCVFTFTIDVPEATFYTLEMERRGELTYSKQELDEAGWHVDLSIGP